eukprot:353436-Chlamydomonas_euryale.AAC.16
MEELQSKDWGMDRDLAVAWLCIPVQHVMQACWMGSRQAACHVNVLGGAPAKQHVMQTYWTGSTKQHVMQTFWMESHQTACHANMFGGEPPNIMTRVGASARFIALPACPICIMKACLLVTRRTARGGQEAGWSFLGRDNGLDMGAGSLGAMQGSKGWVLGFWLSPVAHVGGHWMMAGRRATPT